MSVSVFWVKVIQGLIIMFAMFIDAQRVRYRKPQAKAAAVVASPANPA